MYDLTLQSDAYHMTMGYLIEDPYQLETHVLYARVGGPQVVPDLGLLLQRLVAASPTVAQVQTAAKFWSAQGIPFAKQAWMTLATSDHLPLSVQGVADGEVVLPGDPIALIRGPAVLVGVIEPLLIGELMTSMQIATRMVKVGAALCWDWQRIFEVGFRAAHGVADHTRKLAILQRVGLRFSSHGAAARTLGLQAVGTMGHRYSQRFVGKEADYRAFDQAVTQMLCFRQEQGIERKLGLSFLLDTRSTLTQGLPAAVRVLQKRAEEIRTALVISVRLDSGDMRAQLREIIRCFQQELGDSGLQPNIIVESGLTAADIADYEAIAREMAFDVNRMSYGLGGYLVGGVDRDQIALVYKITGYGGHLESAEGYTPTMKFGDEPNSGKESYPGQLVLWERETDGKLDRILGIADEAKSMVNAGYHSLFVPLVIQGCFLDTALRTDAAVQKQVQTRWQQVAGGYVGEAKEFKMSGIERRRPHYSLGLQTMVDQLRKEQFGT